MSRHVATFSTPYDADRTTPSGKTSVKVIAIVTDENADPTGILYVVVDHDHRTALVPATELTFTDSEVQPPRYG